MPIALLDVNVLFALAWADHIHHESAHQWFDFQRHHGWATCPMTQCGFVRISSNPKVSFVPTSPFAAIEQLSRMISFAGHVFWPDDVQVSDVIGPTRLMIMGHLQIADAYLLGLAMRHGGRLATFDKRAASLAIGNATGAVDVIPSLAPPNN